MPNINIERLAQQKTRITEVHLPPIPDVPVSLLKFPGVQEWNRQLKLMRERDQEQLYRALLNKSGGDNGDCTCVGEKGDKGDTGDQGIQGIQGAPGSDGTDGIDGEDGADGAAGGAPSAATYIVQTPDGTLTNEQALSLLATGLLKSTTGTGAVSIAVAGTDYQIPLIAGTDYEVPLTFTGPLSRAVNAISIPQANGSTDGFLDSADWATFNSKQDALPVSDATAIVKGSVTASKLLRFEVDGFTAATTRVITPPDADIALPGTNIANTWEQLQTLTLGASIGAGGQIFLYDTGGAAFASGAALFSDVGELSCTGLAVNGAATIGALTGVIMGSTGVLSAVADLPFSSLTQGSALSVLGVTGNATADVASIAAGSDHQVLRRSGTALAFGQVNIAQSAAITGTLPIGNGGTNATSYGASRIIFMNSANTALSSDSNFTWDLTTLKMGITVPGVAYVNKISINETAAAAAHIITHNNTASGYGHWTISNGASWNNQFGLMRMYGASHAANHYMSLDSVTNADFFIILAQGCANGLAIGSPDNVPVRFFNNDRERIKIATTETVFNDNSLDHDFRVETDGDANALFIDAGNNRIGLFTAVPTAKLHLPAGTATASTAPLKLTSGTNLTTAEAGAMEYDGTELYFSPSTVRLKVLRDTLTEGTNIVLGTATGTKIGTATTQKLGLWNATPIVQPTTAVAAATFVANTSLIANDTATFDGYTIGQVVKALRNCGILA